MVMFSQSKIVGLPRLALEMRLPAEWLRELTEAGRLPHLEPEPGRYLFAPSAVEDALAELAAAPPEIETKPDTQT